ncbi:MAG: hypothetical protein HQ592_17825, partial [Planctomycetes bacterium]|nr:hypothetical protein [Planctomycetota bacterium]
AEYAVRRHTLTVQSTSITGVDITGDKPGATDYTATCDDQDVVSLTAPEVVWRGDDSYIFIRWKRDEADQMPGQTTVQIRMAADHRVQAVYRRMGSVYIEGPDDRGEGPLPIGGGEFTVDIYAEDMLDFAGFNMALEFALNDAIDNFPIAMGGPVQPFAGMKIIRNEAFLPYVEGASNVEKQVFSLISKQQEWIETGIAPMFGYWGDYTDKTITGKTLLVTVTLECTPADPGGTYTIGSHTPTAPDFEERTTFGSRGETGIEAIPFEVITGSVTITAPVTHTLAVQSAPIAGFAISGDKPGATDYTATCDDLDEITLTAQPSAVGADGNNYTFLFWSIDNQNGILHETSALLLMDRDHNAEAVYNLLGDSNADCIVNILDLLFVRNRLQGDPTSGDNWRADLNGDGIINILDLLGVRNELQTGCGG